MNLIVLLSIPTVIMTVITVYALVLEKKDKKADRPEVVV
jgi:hypothetical protein